MQSRELMKLSARKKSHQFSSNFEAHEQMYNELMDHFRNRFESQYVMQKTPVNMFFFYFEWMEFLEIDTNIT